MQLSNEWFASAEETNMGLVVVRGRMGMDAVRQSDRYPVRVEVQWQIVGDDKGMPTDTEAEVIERMMNIVCDALERSETAVMTAIYTGAQQVRYQFYASSVDAFSASIEPLLQRFGNLPIKIGAAPDGAWREYTTMLDKFCDVGGV